MSDLILPNGGEPKKLILPAGQSANGHKPEKTDAEKDAELNKAFPMAETLVLIDGAHVRPAMLRGDDRACIMITIQGLDAKEADVNRQLRRAITGMMRYDAAMELSQLLKRHAMAIPLKVR